jgi:hypothetical protein
VGAVVDSPLITQVERRMILTENIRHAVGPAHLKGLSCTCGQQH